MQRRLFATFLACACTMAIARAEAHAELEKANPPVGGSVTVAPSEIRLTFSEGIEPKLSGIVLTDATGAKIATGKPARDPQKAGELVVPVPQPLAPGVYTVKWHAVSVDSHKTQGSFTFTLKP